MAQKSLIDGIYNDKLCLGCGLCETVCGKESVEMHLQPDGFFRPVVKKISKDGENIIKKICPGTNIVNNIHFSKSDSVWGKIEKLFSAYSTDPITRTKGSSGGMVSAIAISLLTHKKIDAVLQVGGNEDDYERNTIKISKTPDDVLRCASSRYAPALVFNKLIEILDSNNDIYCFIGKPCDISALNNFLVEYPKFKSRFKLKVSIMCAGMPSFQGTKAIVDSFKPTFPIKKLVYRGNGWPGYFSFSDKSGAIYKKTYNDSWGKTLNKHLNFRCKICPDGIGLEADIAVGDAWETDDGYPDFSEKEGLSLVIARTTDGVAALSLMQVNDEAVTVPLTLDKLKLMQPYQFERRRKVAARVLAYTIITGRIVNYKNMHIWYNLTLEKPINIVKEFLGTFRRLATTKK